MKNIERHSLLDKIGRELQSRMTFDDISVYLTSFGVDTSKAKGSYNSKWIFAKDLLATVPNETILRIANELEIPHGFTVTPVKAVVESNFWEANYFRLFVSHISSFKITVGILQAALRRYAISAFVAHVDIDPTKEWQAEIEAALFSMDGLAAVLMPGFKESNWTDQEVGIAIGRGVLVIPIMREQIPYGFIGKYQGLNAIGKSVNDVAEELFRILLKSETSRSRMISCLTDSITQARSVDEALEKLSVLSKIPNLSPSHLERLRETSLRSALLTGSDDFVAGLNELLRKHSVATVSPSGSDAQEVITTDDIPF